jgi:hypothetical protein
VKFGFLYSRDGEPLSNTCFTNAELVKILKLNFVRTNFDQDEKVLYNPSPNLHLALHTQLTIIPAALLHIAALTALVVIVSFM